jgi:peptide/nickel transport system permease protein
MAQYVVRRVLSGILMLLALTALTFAIFVTIPANPGYYITGYPPPPTPAQLRAADHELGVDRPVWVQYLHFVERLAEGDLGNSYASRAPVSTIIAGALPVTASIVLGGIALTVLAALGVGLASALRPHTVLDRALNTLTVCGVALHPLVVALVLQSLFVFTIRLAPASGYCALHGHGACGAQAWASHLALPWLTFVLYLLPLYAWIVRSRSLEILQQPHIVTARAKGCGERHVIRTHVLPLLVPTLATMVALDIGTSLMAAIYIEAAFALPGVGTQALQAQTGQVGFDLPVIAGIVTVVAATVIVLNVLADLIAVRADPRLVVGRRRFI